MNMTYYKIKWIGVGAPIYYKVNNYWQVMQLLCKGFKIEYEQAVLYENGQETLLEDIK